MRADIVVDLQFGSTGKGAVAAYLAKRMKYDASVRVQSVQAGHTVYHNGKAYKMRLIPCAWVEPNVELVLGPGCFIDRQLLLDEIKMVSDAMGEDLRDRLLIDRLVFCVKEEDVLEEQRRALQSGMGSTAHGAGASLVRKMWRDSGTRGQVDDDGWCSDHGIRIGDTVEHLQDKVVLVEGCQGTMLSIHTSPYYPFVTTREATASGIAAEAGIAPRDVRNVFGVFRSLPIRVGGNSGPTGSRELTWGEVNARAGREVEPERTTVTNRVRRIFEFNDRDFEHALRVNKPTMLFMTFADYLAPDVYGKTRQEDVPPASWAEVQRLINRVERMCYAARVAWVGTGEQESHFIEVGR